MDKETNDCIPTGIPDLDVILRGGIPSGSVILLAGGAGSGKTTLATQWLFAGYEQYKYPGVFISLTESVTRAVGNCRKFSFFKEEHLGPMQIYFTDLRRMIKGMEIENEQISFKQAMEIVDAIVNMIQTSESKRVVIDSITAIAYRLKDRDLIRNFIFELGTALSQLDVTVFMTSEVNESGYSVFGVEEFISDGIIHLSHQWTGDMESERRIRVVKLRGLNYDDRATIFRTTIDGIQFYPFSQRRMSYDSSEERVQTGVPGLDEMASGGFFKGSAILLTGPSGTGKSLLSTQMIVERCRQNMKSIIFSFEESKSQIFKHAKAFGWDLEEYEKKGLVKIICSYPDERLLEEHIRNIIETTEEMKAEFVVIDSISALASYFPPKRIHDAVSRLIARMRANQVVSIFTNASSNLLGGDLITDGQLSTLSDAIIMLRYVEVESELRHGIVLLKMRGSKQDRGVKEVTFKEKGLAVSGDFIGMEGVLSGTARGLDKFTRKQLENVTETLNKSSLVAMTDVEGSITYVNDKFLEVSKYKKEEILGQNHRILKSGFHTPEFYEDLWETIASGKVWRGELRNRAKDGSIYWVRSTLMPSFSETGSIDGYVAVRTPITDAMRPYEEAIHKMEKGEEVSEEMKEVINELKSGRYNQSRWQYNWVLEEH